MHKALKSGLYEQVVNQWVATELANTDRRPHTAAIDVQEAAKVLAQYLARHVEVNHFVETVLKTTGGAEIMRWRPRCGTRPIL